MLAIPLILLLLSIGVARFALDRHREALRTGARHTMPGAQSAAEAAREFLDVNHATQVRIVEHEALVSDYYDPKRATLFLSTATMHGTDAASWAVALHEAAHALQKGETAKALDWRLGNVRLARYAPALTAALCLLMVFLKRLPIRGALIVCGVIFALITVVNVMSMPVEVNASQRAQAWLEDKLRKHPALLELLTGLLSRVAWRDTGALARSPVYFLFGLLPVGGKLRR